MMWLGFGLFTEVNLSDTFFYAAVRVPARRRRHCDLSERADANLQRMECLYPKATGITLRLVCGIPAIGGLVVVGQMIRSYGSCIKIYEAPLFPISGARKELVDKAIFA